MPNYPEEVIPIDEAIAIKSTPANVLNSTNLAIAGPRDSVAD